MVWVMVLELGGGVDLLRGLRPGPRFGGWRGAGRSRDALNAKCWIWARLRAGVVREGRPGMAWRLKLGGGLICFGAAPRAPLWGMALCWSKPRCPKREVLDLSAPISGGVVWGGGLVWVMVLELGGGVICFGAAPRAPLWGMAWCWSRPRCPKREVLDLSALLRAGWFGEVARGWRSA